METPEPNGSDEHEALDSGQIELVTLEESGTYAQWGHFFRNLAPVLGEGKTELDWGDAIPVPNFKRRRFEIYMQKVFSGQVQELDLKDLGDRNDADQAVENPRARTEDLPDLKQLAPNLLVPDCLTCVKTEGDIIFVVTPKSYLGYQRKRLGITATGNREYSRVQGAFVAVMSHGFSYHNPDKPRRPCDCGLDIVKKNPNLELFLKKQILGVEHTSLIAAATKYAQAKQGVYVACGPAPGATLLDFVTAAAVNQEQV